MSVSHTRAVVRIAVAGVALGLVVAGCSKDNSSSGASSGSSSASSSAASSKESSVSSEAPTSAAAAADYSSLLLKPDVIPAGAGAFIADAPQLNPNGIPGAAQLLHTEDNSALIGDTVLITESPEKASAALENSKQSLPTEVTGTPGTLASVSPDATIAAGTSPDGSKAVTVLLFTEQNAIVSLEFDSAPGDLNPVPTDFVESVGKLQQDAIKTGLPNIGK